MKRGEGRPRVARWGFALVVLGMAVVAGYSVVASWGKTASDPQKRTVAFTYGFTIKAIPAGADRVFAWVPYPVAHDRQTVEPFVIDEKWSYEVVTDPEYGNRFVRLDLSREAREGAHDIDVELKFVVTRTAYRVLGESGRSVDLSFKGTANRHRYLVPDRLVPTDGKIAEEAQRIAQGANSPQDRSRRLYDHIVSTVSYDKSGQGWGRGDASYACDIRKGNCTDFHSLFIGEARSLRIPARFVIGFPIPEGRTEGEIPGYHCWAEFYLRDRGWVPIDASEASKHPEKKEEFYGGLDANRIEFTTGRDIKLPGSAEAPVNYTIYPHVEVDGKLHQDVKTRFSFRETTSREAAALSWRTMVAAPLLVVLWLLETWLPAIHERRGRLRHGWRNLAVSFLNAVPLVLVFASLTVLVTVAAHARGWGLLNFFSAPAGVIFVLAILAQDFWMYLWHRANHVVPVLWRFHRMHHSDPDMDVTTAFRFHLGEVILSAFLRLGLIALLGLSVWHIVLYEMLLLPVIMFHHSNVKLHPMADRLLRMALVTRRMHEIHHSTVQAETDSNYGSIFSWWDRVAVTFRMRKDHDAIRYGLEGWDHPDRQSLVGLLRTPFYATRTGSVDEQKEEAASDARSRH